MIFPRFILRALPIVLVLTISGQFAPAPVSAATLQEVSAAKFSEGPLTPSPDGWTLTGAPGPDLEIARLAPDSRAIRLSKEPGPARILTIPLPGLATRTTSPRVTFLIEIGAGAPSDKPASAQRALHWFVKKGTLDLRADASGIFLTDTNKKRTLITPPSPAAVSDNQLARIELDYDTAAKTITAARVNNVAAPAFEPVSNKNLLLRGGLQIIAPTGSTRSVLLRRVAITNGITSAMRNDAAVPRWLHPISPPAEPSDTPNPPLPTWTPLPRKTANALTFTPDPARLANPPFAGEILLSRADFARLTEALATQPDLRAAWETSEKAARQLLADGNWSHWFPDPAKTGRYTYTIRGILPRLALLHAASGQPDLGQLVRLLTLDLIRRPLPFWTHAELRKYDPAAPLGRLETAELARGLALAWQWSADLFPKTEPEHAEIRAALTRKGLDPSLRWLQDPERRNNFMAVIGGGALAAARILDDAPAAELAATRMEDWLGLIENDGSYGEPVGYFEYGASAFFYGWWALGRDEGVARLHRHPALKGTLPWMAAHYVLHRNSNTATTPAAATLTPWRVNFGDDDFTSAASPMVCESLALACNDGLGTWMSQNLGPAAGRRSLNIYEFLFRLGSLSHPLPEPIAPPPPLPPARIYDVGPAILRSGWTFDRDIVLALRGAGAARTGYSHDRGNRNAFMLFVDGEIFFAAPGRASYRSTLGREWDWRITSHSAVSLDDQMQLRDRVARYTHFSDDGNLVQLASDATLAYRDAPRSITRRVWMDRSRGLIAIEDIIQTNPSKPSAIGWHLLLANHDGLSRITPPFDSDVARASRPPDHSDASGGWRFQRPDGEVKFWIHASHPLHVEDAPGIMHTAYSYYPGDPGEGKPGSARHLTWRPENNARFDDLRIWTLILTRSQNTPDARATFDASSTSASGPTWTLNTTGQSTPLTFPRSTDNLPQSKE
ncbi:heparinase II/III domain-containing protein [Geminisphaera colitermitum]|uniref:heparinase II/III domain-containing protein n=1 Tax=Geminisphaera colitermitum TaxID=1148786 RepID=UPI0001965096|nr:heparinase II/III family protein [Geminisphaera colitermitum]